MYKEGKRGFCCQYIYFFIPLIFFFPSLTRFRRGKDVCEYSTGKDVDLSFFFFFFFFFFFSFFLFLFFLTIPLHFPLLMYPHLFSFFFLPHSLSLYILISPFIIVVVSSLLCFGSIICSSFVLFVFILLLFCFFGLR